MLTSGEIQENLIAKLPDSYYVIIDKGYDS